jgi:Pectate lyase superfamily protein
MDARTLARRSLLGASATGLAGAALVARPRAAEPATAAPDWINVSAYNADATGVTDSTTAIQDALNAVPRAGGVVYFPPGTYLLNSSALSVKSSQTVIRGDGQGSVLVIGSSFAGSGVIEVTGVNGAVIRDVVISGQSSTYSANPAADGILVQNSGYVVIEDVYTGDLNGYAAQIISNSTGTSWFPIVNNLQASGNKAGLRIAGTSTSVLGGGAQVSNCVFQKIQAGDGLVFSNAQDCLITNVQTWCENSAGNSLHVQGACTALYFSNIDTGALTGSGASTSQPTVLIEGESGVDPQWIVITNSVLQDGTPSVLMTAGRNISIANCHIVRGGNYGIQATGTAGNPQAIISDCWFIQSGWTAGASNYDIDWGSGGGLLITGSTFTTPAGSSQGEVLAAINPAGLPVHAVGNFFTGAPAFGANRPSSARANPGYNPVGALGPPSVPASDRALTNPYGVDCMVYITGGSGSTTAVKIGGIAAFTLPASQVISVQVPAGQDVTLSYTSKPTWAWFGD